MVFGTPTTFIPIAWKRVATPSVSTTIFGPSGRLKGLVREVPRMVPPSWRMPDVFWRVIRKWSSSRRPFQPSRTPVNSNPCCSPRRTTARMTAFRPGQSPPPVRMATFTWTTSVWNALRPLPPRGPAGKRPTRARGLHAHQPQEELLLGVGPPAAVLPHPVGPGRALQPHAGQGDPTVGERGEDVVLGL